VDAPAETAAHSATAADPTGGHGTKLHPFKKYSYIQISQDGKIEKVHFMAISPEMLGMVIILKWLYFLFEKLFG